MNPADVRLDHLGFPIPPTFPGAMPPDATPPKLGRGVFTIRVLLVVVAVFAGAMALVRAELVDPFGKTVAEWLASHADLKYDSDDLDGAERDLDRALAWSDRSPAIFALRGQVRLEKGNLQGSLADFNKLVGLIPNSSQAYVLRSAALQRLERHDDAIRDMSQAVSLRRSTDPRLLNGRAYTRAIAGKELAEALEDIKEALAIEGENSHYLDTQGYIRFLQGDCEAALVDLNKALDLADTGAPWRALFVDNDPVRQRIFARRRRMRDHDLAVMFHHRGQIYEKLGDSIKAAADLQQGDELGYNPAAGVY
ncbi:MAG TPA: hypothetical protein VGG64_28095 [Pirellulales bacterium]|jgi:tetratricopeptide (TPR) repeat protein